MFQEKKFNLGEINGISKKTLEGHIKLYAGYVKHANLILDKIKEYTASPELAEKNSYAVNEMQRRFGFEFGGIRNHELYFSALEGGPKDINKESALNKEIEKTWGSFENWKNKFISISLTRGIGWAVLYWDKNSASLVHAWIDEQHIGQLNADWIIGVDMWEHAYLLDYIPADKKVYAECYLKNINWSIIENIFDQAIKK